MSKAVNRKMGMVGKKSTCPVVQHSEKTAGYFDYVTTRYDTIRSREDDALRYDTIKHGRIVSLKGFI